MRCYQKARLGLEEASSLYVALLYNSRKVRYSVLYPCTVSYCTPYDISVIRTAVQCSRRKFIECGMNRVGFFPTMNNTAVWHVHTAVVLLLYSTSMILYRQYCTLLCCTTQRYRVHTNCTTVVKYLYYIIYTLLYSNTYCIGTSLPWCTAAVLLYSAAVVQQ